MRVLELPGAKDDGYERRPIIFDPKTLEVDKKALDSRIKRNNALRAENAGLILVGVLANEVDFVRFIFKNPKTDAPYSPFTCQVPMLLDDLVCAFCGRNVGKSYTLVWNMAHHMLNYRGGSLLLTSFDAIHVTYRARELFSELDQNVFLSLCKNDGDGNRAARYPWYQMMANGYRLYGIAAGEKSHRGLESPHVPSVFMDEAQHFPMASWAKLEPAIDDQETNRHVGSCIKLFGVNSEGRIDTVFYEAAHKDPKFEGHRYFFRSSCHPTEYTLSKHQDYLTRYGHSVEANEFKQMIRGLIGDTTLGVIPPDAFNAAQERFRKMNLRYSFFRIDDKLWDGHGRDPSRILAGNRFKIIPEDALDTALVYDYGTTAPTEIGLWALLPGRGIDEAECVWALLARIELLRIQGNQQAPIIDYLADLWALPGEPWCRNLAGDCTASTDVVYNVITDPSHPVYNYKNYHHRMMRVDLNGWVITGYEKNKPEDFLPGVATATRHVKANVGGITVYAVHEHANVVSTNEIVRLLVEGKMALPSDDVLRQDFLGLVAYQEANKQVKYKGTPQHIFSMTRALALLNHKMFVASERRSQIFNGAYEPELGCYFSVPIGL